MSRRSRNNEVMSRGSPPNSNPPSQRRHLLPERKRGQRQTKDYYLFKSGLPTRALWCTMRRWICVLCSSPFKKNPDAITDVDQVRELKEVTNYSLVDACAWIRCLTKRQTQLAMMKMAFIRCQYPTINRLVMLIGVPPPLHVGSVVL